ncbi:DUF4231 domain-containing protein [Polymorphobacter sp. PAMC 29334]|uniref:DUF4231 domain-containing protein n=1 Tax=Polymorphobacter sp. PAMC 29334 TaxID=2862331 RepID=UPI001C758C86|nr:DUF4231 domain-containing protein [Polymorphobacter sp. PAMC 29334]QYE33799.1 DUF4231 domain-containing protein [Polymorphobacter sp. PAMC 29334]
MLNLSVGITGHRPPQLDAAAVAHVEARLADVLGQLSKVAAGVGERHADAFEPAPFIPRLLSPLAEGADQIAAQTALEAGYALDAILPLPHAEYRKDFACEALVQFDLLLEQAQRVLELPAQSGAREEGYALAGQATVAHSDLVIAIWDGSPARGRGGTAEIVELALERGIPVIQIPIDPNQPSRILWAGYSSFVHQWGTAATPSRSADASEIASLVNEILRPPADRVEDRHFQTYLAEPERRFRSRAEYPLLLALLGIKRLRRTVFLNPRHDVAARAEWSAFYAACGERQHGIGVSLDVIESRFGWADHLAQHFAQSYRSGHVLNFVLSALAVLIALTGLVFPNLEFWAALCEPLAIIGFVINTSVGARRQWHRRWLEYRQLAERIRLMRSLKLLGVAAPPRLGKESGSDRRWIEWYAAAVWRDSGCPSGTMTDAGALVKSLVAVEFQPQVDYHSNTATQMHRLDHRLHQVGIVLFATSLLSCLSAAICNVFAREFAEGHAHLFIAFSAGLPAVGAAIFGIRMQGDFDASAERSLITAKTLRRIMDALDKPLSGLSVQADLVEAGATAMYSDLGDWHRAYEQRRLELP